MNITVNLQLLAEGYLRPPERYRPVARMLAVSSMLCVGLALGRVAYSGQSALLWLSGNLFLAWIPLAFALAVRRLVDDGLWFNSAPRDRRRLALCASGWLLFLPNAPYLLTDFVHLHRRPFVPVWFDLSLIMSFAWTGLILGHLSLLLMHEAVEEKLGRRVGREFVVGALMLCSFGVYMGRVGRWNSWDVLARPVGLIRWCVDSLMPGNLFLTGAFCGVLFLFLLAGYAVTWSLVRPARRALSEDPPSGS